MDWVIVEISEAPCISLKGVGKAKLGNNFL